MRFSTALSTIMIVLPALQQVSAGLVPRQAQNKQGGNGGNQGNNNNGGNAGANNGGANNGGNQGGAQNAQTSLSKSIEAASPCYLANHRISSS